MAFDDASDPPTMSVPEPHPRGPIVPPEVLCEAPPGDSTVTNSVNPNIPGPIVGHEPN